MSRFFSNLHYAYNISFSYVAIELGIRARIDELGNVESYVLAALAVGDRREDALNRLVVRQDVDWKAKQVTRIASTLE